jgi:hypothetical protein
MINSKIEKLIIKNKMNGRNKVDSKEILQW